MTKLYKIAHHEEVFGDNKPRTDSEIYEKVFGYSQTDSIEGWTQDPKLLKNMKLSTLSNYCTKPGWHKAYGLRKHDELIESIRENGIKVPLVVVKTRKGEYAVIEGHHRAGVARILGIKTVPVFLMEEK